MEIFLDTSRLAEVETWLAHGVVDGVTTNPSILLKDGHTDIERSVRQIAETVFPRPVCAEVWTGDLDEMGRQARLIARWASNVVPKVTIVNEHGEPCLRVVRALADDGIAVNCTACLSFGQAMLAAKAGAAYVSLFVGRINDEGNDGPAVVRATRQWLDAAALPARIIAGSMRTTMDIQQAALAGAHVVTVPPPLLARLADHRYSRATVQQFLDDARAAGSVVSGQWSVVGERA